MRFKNEMMREMKRLGDAMEEKRAMLSTLPEAKIECNRDGDYYRWRVWENGKRRYLSKKDEELARKLVVRRVIEKELEDYEHELRAIKMYLRNCSEMNSAEEYVNRNEEYRRLAKSYIDRFDAKRQEWLKDVYTGEVPNPQGLKYKTLAGPTVRSKSEVIIAGKLYEKGIAFKYEERINVRQAYINLSNQGYEYRGKRVDYLYPDFTIYLPKKERIILWEHFGMMGNPDYARDAIEKMYIYNAMGYLIGRDLIVSFENHESGIDEIWIEKTIEHCIIDE